MRPSTPGRSALMRPIREPRSAGAPDRGGQLRFIAGEQPFPARVAVPTGAGRGPGPPDSGAPAASLAAARGPPAAPGPAPPERNGPAMNHPHSTEQPAQHAEELVSWTGRERLRLLWYRL